MNRLSRGFAALSVGLALSIAMLTPAATQVPSLISYQGQLNDRNGLPVNATVSFVFSLYTVSTGGTALWTEAQTISVSNGVFNVQLGAVQPLPSSVFSQDALYLGVKVGADAEMSPRQRLTASAYSQRAQVVSTPVVPVGGIVAWNKSMTGTPSLPSGWVECNGQVLSDAASPYNGRTIPNLNGVSATPRFLRGGTVSGSMGGSEEHLHESNQAGCDAGGNYRALQPTAPTSTLPSYYSVVWIMRVR